MRWLGWVLLVLGMALAEPPANPSGSTPEAPPAASSDTQGTEVPMGVLLKRLDEARGVWAYFPRLEDEALAQALWKRARQGKGLVLLFPVEEIHNPLSYSNTFFLGKLVWPNTRVRHGVLRDKGDQAIVLVDQEVYLVGEKVIRVSEDKRASYTGWWQRAWAYARDYDALNFARKIYLQPRKELGLDKQP